MKGNFPYTHSVKEQSSEICVGVGVCVSESLYPRMFFGASLNESIAAFHGCCRKLNL